MECSINNISKNNYTCFDKKQLTAIANAFNKYIDTNQICKKQTCAIKKKQV